MVVKEKKVAETNEETVEEKKEQTVVEEQQVVTDPVVESFEEHEPEPLTETQKLDALLKSVEEFAEREAKFNTMVFPVVKSINTKSWWILSLSILAIFILFFLFYFISGKFSEKTEIIVSSISKNLDESKDEIKGLVKSLKEGQVKEMEEMKSKFSGMEKTVNNIEAWAIDTGEIVEKHEGRFVKMSKDISFLKKRKLEEIEKAEAEKTAEDEVSEPVKKIEETPAEAEKKVPVSMLSPVVSEKKDEPVQITVRVVPKK